MNTKRIVAYLLLGLCAAIVIGLLVWQLEATNHALTDLTRLITKKQPINYSGSDAGEPITNDLGELELPVVVFEREGLLNDTERASLARYLIDPYTAFYAQIGQPKLVTMMITVPENESEEYMVNAIFYDGTHHGFLYGKKQIEYRYWIPDCFETCEFSDVFESAFPEVIREYKEQYKLQ